MLGISVLGWGVIVSVVVSIGYPILQLFTKTTAKDANASAIADVQASMQDHDRRLIRIEEQMKALPGARDFTKMNEKMSEMAGDLKSLATEVRAHHESQERIEKSIALINETLMSK
jgi:hypothetical protein